MLADSTVALVLANRIKFHRASGSYEFKAFSLGTRKNLCPGEAFADQPSLAHCSGTLVGPDLVLTAGHCIDDMDDCKDMRFVFGFGLKDGLTSGPGFLPASEVYSCVAVLGTSQGSGAPDMAVIRLDRKVPNHAPLAINRQLGVQPGTPLVVIGHPSGLPTKVAGGAAVRSAAEQFRFVSNLDTYGGNSGSAVFNADTLLIEGILVSGDTDYSADLARGCTVNKRCEDDACRGEKVTPIRYATHLIPEL